MSTFIFSLLVCLSIDFAPVLHARRQYRPPLRPYTGFASEGWTLASNRAVIDDCKEKYRKATVDHFSWVRHAHINFEGRQQTTDATPPEGITTFQQRYFICDKHWRKVGGTPGPIFFYVGNEADVTLYLNNTGLMWESAEDFGALLVFAEHRYYGKSKPYRKNLTDHMHFLTSEQAMADYAELIFELKAELKAEDSAVVGFGGSYGGMLGTWFRYKYPHVIDGVVAGSAPIWDFEGEVPPVSEQFFSRIVTRDATPVAGAAERCAPNMRKAWKTLFDWGAHVGGREKIRAATRLCPQADLNNGEDVEAFAYWLQSAFDYLAMGNYPYPSSYILNGVGVLPAFPMRVACESLAAEHMDETALLEGLATAAGVFYNFSHDISCFNYSQGANEETDEDASFWDYQYCTEQFMPASRDGKTDMFWPQPFDEKAAIKQCQQTWGVTPRPLWATIQWGGKKLEGLTNVVFSNGDYDPWSGGGVLKSPGESLEVVIVEGGAHHLDVRPPIFSSSFRATLMFSNKDDPPSVLAARGVERANIRKWIEESHRRRVKQQEAKRDLIQA